MNFLEEWFEDAKGVVFSPSSFYRDAERHTDFGEPVKFAIVSLAIYGLLSGILSFALARVAPNLLPGAVSGSIVGLLGTVLGQVLGGLLGLFIGAALIHIFVYLFGGRGYQTTFDVMAYATAVSAFFGWIPGVNILAGLYGVYVQARGLENFHEMSFGKAVASILLPAVILIAVSAVAMLVTGFMLMSALGSPV